MPFFAIAENAFNAWVEIFVTWFHYAAMFPETCCFNNGFQAGDGFTITRTHSFFRGWLQTDKSILGGCMPVGNWLITMKNPHVYPQVSMAHIIEVVSKKHTEVQTMLVVLGAISKRLCSRHNPFQSLRAQCGKFPRFLAAAPRNLPPVGWQARPVWKFRTQRDWHFPLPFGV